MIESSAKDLIDKIFSNEFNRDHFLNFSNKFLFSASFQSTMIDGDAIPKIFQGHVQSLERLATYTDTNNKEIDLLIVRLLRDTALDRARTMQRNFIAQYLETESKNAALVAFVSPDVPHWRFSLIKIEAKIVGIEVETTLTPAKRWSFLVGKNEGCHTVKSKLIPILLDDTRAPSLNELEQAFEIETVSNEFFEKYSDLFFRMKESLDDLIENDQDIKIDFTDKEIDTSDFAKKTMGQISFLYFLQKKGWFGVAKGKEWGSGTKNFLREVFNRRDEYGNNFFNDVLEPMFYEALAKDRGNESIYSGLNNTRMPFLNGGLFEPMNNYSWETTQILLSDELFSNTFPTEEGDIGDGILDVFDRYNFTVNESEPLDQEVAVDPEMLGKVFENLLEVKDRKSKGAFYTPREVVQYMCKESLVNYLEANTKNIVPKKDLDLFIQYSSQIAQNDKYVYSNDSQNGSFLLPSSCLKIAYELDDLLAKIKVCDPAVGSGAFPLGMLNEIVSARNILKMHLGENISKYELKLHAISNSIYGVDIDPGAVEIAKLRLWLSLIVEEDNPTPLPNLDHKIMQGDSLISQYENIQLFDDNFLINAESDKAKKEEIINLINAKQKEYVALHSSNELTHEKKDELSRELKKLNTKLKKVVKDSEERNINNIEAIDLFNKNEAKNIAQQKTKTLQIKVAEHILEHSQSKKENLKEEIENLKWDLIIATLEEKNEEDKLENIKKLRRKRIKPFFIWKLEFSDVFKDDGGFDVVIANPPYVDSEEMTKSNKRYREMLTQNYKSTTGNWDLFVPFIEFGINLLKERGSLCYIIPNKLIGEKNASDLREMMLTKEIIEIKDYSRIDVFKNRDVYPITLSLRNEAPKYDMHLSIISMLNLTENGFINKVNKNLFYKHIYWDMYFFHENEVKLLSKLFMMEKVRENYKNIFGAATVGEAYKVKEKIVDAKIDNGKKFINTGTIDPYRSLWGDKKTQYIKDQYLYPMIDISAIKEINPKRSYQADSEKIIVAGMTKKIEAYLDSGEYLAGKSTIIIIDEHKKLLYLTGILNSKLMEFYLSKFFHSKKMAGDFITISKDIIDSIPLPSKDVESDELLVSMVDEMISASALDEETKIQHYQKQIDELVYKLYKLTDAEIESVEASSNS